MKRIPLFVLPTVLFPGARVPLHVFEARYRQMIARCLEFDKRFGFLFHRDDIHGAFRVEPGRVGCVAQINDFQPLPDGRSLLMTEGLERFRIVDGVESSALYHEAVVEPYEDETASDLGLILRRQRTVELFKALMRTLPPQGDAQLTEVDTGRETSFQIAATIVVDPAWQQGLLELRRESERLDRIDQLLRAALESQRRKGGSIDGSAN